MDSEHGITWPEAGIIDAAYEFAKHWHMGQVRKYTGEPYITHPVAVAKRVAGLRCATVDMVVAALCHDVIEDTQATYQDMVDYGLAGPCVDLVRQLTDVSKLGDGNRATRKAIDREHTAKASDQAKVIKLADLIDNFHSITTHDPGFSKVFVREMDLILGRIRDDLGSGLLLEARKLVGDWLFDDVLEDINSRGYSNGVNKN